MTALPPEISPNDEVEVSWVRDEFSTRVIATLGEASVTVETSEDGAPLIPWLVAAMPSVLEAAWAAIENDDKSEEDK